MARNPLTSSIGRKLLAGFAMVLGLVVLTVAVSLAGFAVVNDTVQQGQDVGFQLYTLANEAQVRFVSAQNMLLNYQVNYGELGLEMARAVYLPTAINDLNSLEESLTAIEALEVRTGNEDSVTRVQFLLRSIQGYREDMTALADAIDQRGVLAEGAIGDLRQDANALHAALRNRADPALRLMFFEIRSREREYIMAGDPDSIQQWQMLVEQLEAQAAAAGLSGDFEALFTSYQGNFQALQAADATIETLIRQTESNARQFERLIITVVEDGAAAFNGATEAIFAQVSVVSALILVVGLAAIVAGLVLAVIITRSITRPVRAITHAAGQITAGDLSRRVEVHTRDEIAEMGRAFNTMTGRLQDMVEAEQAGKLLLEEMVAEYVAFTEAVAAGDLTTRLRFDGLAGPDPGEAGPGEAGHDLYRLGLSLNAMVESLSQVTSQMRDMAAQVSGAAAEILASTAQQIATATQQNAAVTQTMATVEEVQTTVAQTAERAQLVADFSTRAVDVSRTGENSVSHSVAGMAAVQDRVAAIAENILALSERTQQIGEIIDSVNDLAEQSKLLALNASIEAARAGEEGRGFAVVAEEVRQLAGQSRQATARVRDILGEIQGATNTAVMVTEEGSKGAQAGMELVSQAGQSLAEMASMIEESAQAAAQIAASTHQQTNGMDQLRAAMTSIQQASTQTAASTRQAEQSANALHELARQMEAVVAHIQA